MVEEVHPLFEQALAVLLGEEIAGVRGIKVAFQDDLRAWADSEWLDELSNPLNASVVHHLSNLVRGPVGPETLAALRPGSILPTG